ncbi:hypothetical protein L1049_015994 [Liquidambar formosana]|uniref:Uncharacterized protein n=1 Tax=Liquidambar formosana TaxID=63359 RepID=A0AAP0X6H6_LIQFO
MLVRARSNGWRVVVFNSRGCGESPVTTPQFYSASFIEDLCEVVSHVATRYPKANLYAVGWSLGANILESHSCPLSGAVSLCNPFDLVIADEDFHKGFNIVYDKSLASALCKIFKKHALLFEDIGGEYNIPVVANAKSVREFDEGLTCGIYFLYVITILLLYNGMSTAYIIYNTLQFRFGFKSVDDYYSNSSSSDSIKHVVQEALDKANLTEKDLSAVAVTIGLGLSLCLRVGVRKARKLFVVSIYQLLVSITWKLMLW